LRRIILGQCHLQVRNESDKELLCVHVGKTKCETAKGRFSTNPETLVQPFVSSINSGIFSMKQHCAEYI
jgi:hypothetical protein